MSKQSIKLNTNPFVTFLSAISKNNRWKSFDNLPIATILSGYILVNAEAEDGTDISLHLMQHEELPLLLVAIFEVDGENKVDGSAVLGHHGKRLAHSIIKRSTNLEEFWTIKCAKDVESLFRAHDNLSRILSADLVFDIDKERKIKK